MSARRAALALLGAIACDRPRAEPPLAELHVAVRDEDGDLPLVAHVELRRTDGAGPLAKSLDLRGEATVTMRPGRYRVVASRGLEWTVEQRVVELASRADLSLRLRHVVRSDTLVPCELRAAPDASTIDARFLALASAGVRFAAAREHEDSADYAAAASRASLAGRVVFAPAAAVPRAPGYPARTYVDIGGWLGGWEQGYSGAPLDPNDVLLSLREGRSFVTNGPILEVAIDDARLGDALVWRTVVHAHVRVYAAPWVDVTSIEILADGTASRRAAVGAASTDALAPRFDATLDVPLAPGVRSLSVVIRGDDPSAVGTPSEGSRPFAETSPFAISAGPAPVERGPRDP